MQQFFQSPTAPFRLALGILLATIFLTSACESPKKVPVVTGTDTVQPAAQPAKPQFRKDAQLRFLDASGKELALIDIEIADDEASREQGLMYRESMDEMQGMLFIMEREEQQAFWMKNTIMPLDIIYVNADHEVVDMFVNTKPYSLESLPSKAPAAFVVEVNAGFASRHGIKKGTRLVF